VELVVLSLVPQVKRGTPLMPANCIERGELCAGVDAAAAVGSTLVCAPPGLGKTLLLTEWAIRPRPVETAWVTFDGGDNDPRRLWASVLAALARRTSLQPSNSIPSSLAWSAAEHTEFVSELVDQLHSLPSPIRLILDDVDELTDPEAWRGLQILADNVPSQIHLVLSGGFDPPLGRGRLRRSGRLGEIRTDRLRFTSAESATLLARAGLRLTAPQAARLHHRTNGWAAGLRLAALALTDAPDPDRFLVEFSDDGRCVADYLTGVILNRLRPGHAGVSAGHQHSGSHHGGAGGGAVGPRRRGRCARFARTRHGLAVGRRQAARRLPCAAAAARLSACRRAGATRDIRPGRLGHRYHGPAVIHPLRVSRPPGRPRSSMTRTVRSPQTR